MGPRETEYLRKLTVAVEKVKSGKAKVGAQSNVSVTNEPGMGAGVIFTTFKFTIIEVIK